MQTGSCIPQTRPKNLKTVSRQTADRTGELVFNVLWSYVEDRAQLQQYIITTLRRSAPLRCPPRNLSTVARPVLIITLPA